MMQLLRRRLRRLPISAVGLARVVDTREEPDVAFRRNVLVGCALGLFALIAIGTVVRHAVSPMPVRILVSNAVVAAVFFATPVFARRGASPFVLALPLMLGLAIMIYNGGMLAGGISAPVCALMPILPMLGFCFGGRRLGVIGLGAVIALIVWLVVAERLGLVDPILDPARVSMQRASMLVIIVLGAFVIGATYEAARRRFEQRLVEVSRLASLGTMASGIAHEINNPLAIITGHAGMLERMAEAGAVDRAELASVARRIAATSKRMANIVAGLRTYARDDAALELMPVSVVACIADACALSAERFKNAGVELRIGAVPPELQIMARPTQVTQVVLNLLNNAFDAVDRLPTKWVEIACAVDAAMVAVSVTDSGPGIPRGLRSKIFVPFFTTKDVGRGTGLGLSICAGIMAQHGGDIGVDEGAGNTRFVVRFRRWGVG